MGAMPLLDVSKEHRGQGPLLQKEPRPKPGFFFAQPIDRSIRR